MNSFDLVNSKVIKNSVWYPLNNLKILLLVPTSLIIIRNFLLFVSQNAINKFRLIAC